MDLIRVCAYDYIPCIMNQKQIKLAESVLDAIKGTNTYKAALDNNVDFVVVPKGNDAINIHMTDLHYDKDVRNNRTLVQTPFSLVEVPSVFKHKVGSLLKKMNIYLEKAYNVKVE